MTTRLPFETPSEVTAVKGEVHVDGPDGIAFVMMPEAAAETGRRLLAASAEAQRHKSDSIGAD